MNKNTCTITLDFVKIEDFVLEVKSEQGFVAGTVRDFYFSECDGTSLTDILSLMKDSLPKGSQLNKSNTEVWIETWDEEGIDSLNGKSITVEYTIEEDEDGDIFNESVNVL